MADRKVRVALIGAGNRAAEDEMEFSKTGLMQVVALCDVDIEGKQCEYAVQKYPDVPRYTDWRRMFDEIASEFEAVIVATPDHSHFAIAMRALREGKHVYLEKPMCRTFLETQLLMDEAAAHPEIVTQMGNQGHSGGNYFQFKLWMEAGLIQDVTRIDAFMNEDRRWFRYDPAIKRFPEGKERPQGMNWDTWLSSAPYHDFCDEFHQGNWRSWYDFGMGALGDWGAHIIDAPHRFLKLGLPYEVQVLKSEGHNDYFFPMASTLLFRFPRRGTMPACDIYWYDGKDNYPEFPEGFEFNSRKPGYIAPGKILYTRDYIMQGGHHNQKLKIIPKEVQESLKDKLPYIPKSPSNHYENFLKACLGEEKTRSPFEEVGELCQVFNLGVIAQRLGHGFKFDRGTRQIVDDPFANSMLAGEPPRKGWEEYFSAENI